MKLETAIKQLKKEAEFVGWTAPDIVRDIAKHGRRMYSERTMTAYYVVQAKFPIQEQA
jgi:hypothetical protein